MIVCCASNRQPSTGSGHPLQLCGEEPAIEKCLFPAASTTVCTLPTSPHPPHPLTHIQTDPPTHTHSRAYPPSRCYEWQCVRRASPAAADGIAPAAGPRRQHGAHAGERGVRHLPAGPAGGGAARAAAVVRSFLLPRLHPRVEQACQQLPPVQADGAYPAPALAPNPDTHTLFPLRQPRTYSHAIVQLPFSRMRPHTGYMPIRLHVLNASRHAHNHVAVT